MKAAALTLYAVALLAGLIGWFSNLLTVIAMAMAGAPLESEFVLRVIGVPFAFLGAVLGWLG